jgi:hypothetical protein
MQKLLTAQRAPIICALQQSVTIVFGKQAYIYVVHRKKEYAPTTSDPLKRGNNKMILGKMKILLAAASVAFVISSGAFAWVHNRAATADQRHGINYVVGQDGKLIGTAHNPSIRAQWQREGLPN